MGTQDNFDAQADAPVAEAAAWLVRLRDPSCSAESRRAFARWLESDPAHRAEFARVEQTWDDVAVVKAELPGMDSARARLAAHRRRPARGGRDFLPWLKMSALAATVVVLAYAGNAWMASNVASFTATYVTAVGESRHIALEDGTRIQLNTDSKLKVALYRARRITVLERGEAWFEVAHDASRPFSVAAGPATVQVVGTRFSVRDASESLDVAVDEGKVRVFRTADPADGVTLVRGQGLRMARNGAPLQAAAVEVEQQVAWRSGRLIVSERPLGEVAAELARYRGTAIRLSPEAAQLPVTAVINLRSADAWLAALPATLPIRTARDGSGNWDIEAAPAEHAEAPVTAVRRLVSPVPN